MPLIAHDLRCDGLAEPLGVDAAPRLSWKLRGGRARDERQTAWHVRAWSPSGSPSAPDRWDSGRVPGDAQAHVSWAGVPLGSAATVFWQVRVWDAAGAASPWSEVASFTTGLLDRAAWAGARWVADPEQMRWVRTRLGYSSPPAENEHTPHWLQLDLGAAFPLEAVRLHAVTHGVTERLGFPLCLRLEASLTPDFAEARVIADHTAEPLRNLWANRLTLAADGVTARHLRLVVPRLRMMREDELDQTLRGRLALSQIEVLSGGRNVAVGATVTASASLEDERWSASALVDGLGVPGANPRAAATLRLRREFVVARPPRRALLFVCGLGHADVTVNGAPVAEDLLSPGWTEPKRTCLYETRDVTALLRPGANAIGLTLAGGMFNVPPAPGRYTKFAGPYRPLTAIACLRVEHDDGVVEHVVTDEAWQVATGPTTWCHVFGGEDHDARLEEPGWDQPGFAAAGWTAVVTTAGPGGRLRGTSHAAPPLRRHEDLPVRAVTTLPDGAEVLDLGQNAALMLEVQARGTAGSTVKVVPAELVKPDGSIDRVSCGGGEASWNLTLAAEPGGEAWRPRFFYHGARYLRVERHALPGERPPEVAVRAWVVHSASPAAGDFACSCELLNRIRTLVRWAQRSNLSHVLTDCPHRERLGWLEQYHLNGPALRSEWDVARLFRKGFGDMADAQQSSGLVPDIAPEFVRFDEGFRDSPEWGGACVLAAWQHYVWTGDTSVLRARIGTMRRYVDYLAARSSGFLLNHGLGDWYDLGPERPGHAQLTPVGLTATAIYHDCTATLGRILRLLGDEEAARELDERAIAIAAAFHREYFNPVRGCYATGSQTAQAVPLALGLVPAECRERVLAALLADLAARDHAVTAGDVGYRFVLRALADAGRSDLVFAMVNRTDRPGYGWQLARGATALAEAWDANPRSSQNHFMLGQITEWLYADLAGLAPDETAPGFARARIRPQPVPGVDWARANHESIRGRFAVAWRRGSGGFSLGVEVTLNAGADVTVPGARAADVREGGRPAADEPGLELRRETLAGATFRVGAGRYRFTAPLT